MQNNNYLCMNRESCLLLQCPLAQNARKSHCGKTIIQSLPSHAIDTYMEPSPRFTHHHHNNPNHTPKRRTRKRRNIIAMR